MNSKNITCPHCGVNICADFEIGLINVKNSFYSFYFQTALCPSCENPIIYMENGYNKYNDCYEEIFVTTEELRLIYPRFPYIEELNDKIPQNFLNDYYDAKKISLISPRASVILCRYLIEEILKIKFNITGGSLCEKIDLLKKNENLSNDIIEKLSIIRLIGNKGAHDVEKENFNIKDVNILLDFIKSFLYFIYVTPIEEEEKKQYLKNKFKIKY